MTDQHPITPPPELFKQWEDNILNERDNVDHVLDCAWRNGFQAGADQELEACCEWLINEGHEYEHVALRDARRPQPLSLKELALETLRSMQIDPVILDGINVNKDVMDKYDILRRALESLSISLWNT